MTITAASTVTVVTVHDPVLCNIRVYRGRAEAQQRGRGFTVLLISALILENLICDRLLLLFY